MIGKLKQTVYGFRKVAGVEVVLLSEGQLYFNVSVLQLSKSIISPVLQKGKVASVDEIRKLIGDIPVVLSVTGKGVLVKKTDKSDGEKDFSEILPNAKEEDFVYSIISGSGYDFFALLRKESVLNINTSFANEGLKIVDVLVGPAALSGVTAFTKNKEIFTSTYKVNVDSGEVHAIQNHVSETTEDLTVGDEKIPAFAALAFSGAFNFLLHQNHNSQLKQVEENFQEWKDKKLYGVLSKSVAGILATAVFLNLFLFFYFSSQNNELSSKNSSLLVDIQQLEEVQNEFKEKERFLKKAGWLTPSRVSFYADQIAAGVPKSVSLTELSINIFDEHESRKEKKLVFQNRKILLKGTCKDPVVINPWLKELQELPFVKSAGSKKYLYDSKDQIGEFELEVLIKGND